MNRRAAVKQLTLWAFAAALSGEKVLHAEGGQLRVPLDAWSVIIFERKGKRIVVPIDEVFDALGVSK